MNSTWLKGAVAYTLGALTVLGVALAVYPVAGDSNGDRAMLGNPTLTSNRFLALALAIMLAICVWAGSRWLLRALASPRTRR